MLAKNQKSVKRFFFFPQDSNTLSRYPLLDHIIMVYIGIVLLTYALFLIAPFVTLIAKTPLYSIQSYLGILGMILILEDFFLNKGLWRGPYVILLFGIGLSALISSFLTISYGVKDNLFDFCWVLIQFALFYSSAYRLDYDTVCEYVKIFFVCILLIWFIACGYSIYQYLYQIGYRYLADPVSNNPELVRQGFLDNRLFGVFTGLDYAAYISMFLLCGCVHCIVSTQKKGFRVFLILVVLVLLSHILLSGSRSVQISLFLYVFFFSYLFCRNRIRKYVNIKKVLACLLISCCAVGVSVGFFVGMKEVYSDIVWKISSNAIVSTEKSEESEEDQNTKDILQREKLDDVSNNRFAIWKDYLTLSSNIGLFGLSLSNYNDYISDTHPQLYIVQYFSDYSDSGKTDMVYESHNNYLFVFVSTGLMGLLLFLSFMILAFIRVFRYFISHPKVSLLFITSLAIVCIGCVEALFMNSVFLKINALSFIFWLFFGILMKETMEVKS